MLEKSKQGGLKSVTEFRVVKQYINNAVKANRVATISKRLKEYADEPALESDHLNIESAAVAAEAKKLLRSVNILYQQISDIEIEEFYGQEAMWDRLESLANLIRQKLKALGRRDQ
jgi:hypothetical protein